MNQDDTIRMAREAGIVSPEETGEVWCAGEWQLHEFANLVIADYQERTKWDGIHTCHSECQRPVCVSIRKAVNAEREKVAKWMLRNGYATGHGDTTEDLLAELDWQFAESLNRELAKGSKIEREECAKVLDDLVLDHPGRADLTARQCAFAIRERGAP